MNTHPIDGQQVAALAIVAVAAFFVLKRMWGQLLAFRARPARRAPSKMAAAKPSAPRPQPLIQIQTIPPRHMKRPSQSDTHP